MAGEIASKAFTGGMNKDIDYSLLKDNQYVDAQNYKLISDENANGFAFENAEGNSLWLDISDISGIDDTYFLVGHTFIQPYLVLFFTTTNKDRSPSGGTSKIVRVTVDKNIAQQSSVIYDDSVVTGSLDFSTTYPIKAVSHYESDDNIKIYWTDGYNDVRWANIMDTSLSTYPTNLLELVPDFPVEASTATTGRPSFNSYISGNIDCSSVQYAYQLYIENGPSTVFGPASTMIQIPKTYSTSSVSVAGGDEDEDSGYGVSIDIDLLSGSFFNRIRVVAIQYDTYNGVPTVRIVEDKGVTSSTSYTLIINDVGDTLGEITYDEYLVQSNSTFAAKELAIKDNYLFAANIRETSFDVDVDCRAYRHNSGGIARIYDSDLTNYDEVDDSNTPTYWGYDDVPETHDCINKYNKSVYNSSDDELTHGYKFQADGTTIGASGANIDVGILTDTTDVLDTLNVTSKDQWLSTTNLYTPGDRSFQRNEVYRIGVIFRNEKLQASPVKWICDFKLPNMYEESVDYGLTTGVGTEYRRRLGIYIAYHGGDVSWSNTGATSFELVAVPRESEDRSILAQGIIQPTLYDTTDSPATYWPKHSMALENLAYSSGNIQETVGLVRLISPEISFNKNLTYQSEDFLHYIGFYQHAGSNEDTSSTGIYKAKVYNHLTVGSSFTAAKKKEIDDFSVVGYVANDGLRISIDAKEYQPYVEEGASPAAGDTGPCTTHGVLSTNTDIDNTWWTGGSDVPMANYKRDVFQSQYGGLDYASRQNNVYISISDPKIPHIGVPTANSYEGDVFIDWFQYVNACTDLDKAAADTQASTFLFPIETSISLSHRLDDGIHRNPGILGALLTQEISGTHESDAVDGTTRTWEQDLPLYQYNPVYSQQNKSAFFYPASEGFSTTEDFPTRIKNSDLKINGESIDSFSTFRVNNFIDVTGKHGPINNIEIFNNRLYYWQNNAFGIASVNTRSLIQDNEPGLLALGTGGILDRIDYISDSVGNTNKFGIAISRRGMYWIDNNKNEFFKFDGKLNSVSKLGGIQTWLTEQGQIGDAKLAYDNKYNDVIFTITFARQLDCETASGGFATAFTLTPSTDMSVGVDYDAKVISRYTANTILPENNVYSHAVGTATLSENPYGTTDSNYYITIDNDPSNTYTIIFNELVDSFVSFNSCTPAKYIKLSNALLSSDAYGDLYLQNDGSKATYYGTTYDSEFTTVFNKDYPYTKTWDSLKWYSESEDSNGINQFKDTFDTLTISNDYQHTGDRDLYYKGDSAPATRPTEIVRRDRTFSMQIPRNIVDVDVSSNPDITDSGNWDETQTFKERIRDKYILLNTTYDNTNGYVFSVPFIRAVYRKSVR